jgi:hypothetical protein
MIVRRFELALDSLKKFSVFLQISIDTLGVLGHNLGSTIQRAAAIRRSMDS